MPDDVIIEFEGHGWNSSFDDNSIQIGPDGDSIQFDSENMQIKIPFRLFGRLARLSLWVPAVSVSSAQPLLSSASYVEKAQRHAGVLMLAGALPAIFTGIGFITFLLLILAGIFALVPDKPAQNAAPCDSPSGGRTAIDNQR